MWSGRTPESTTRPPVAQIAIAYVPASTRSGITECSTASNPSTPSISIVGVPTPCTRAPISTRNSARSTSSGSRAAFSITVVPRAATAAIRTFSVAPTLGKSRFTTAPRSPLVSPTRNPCSEENVAPIFSRPLMCRSIAREPMLQPPGIATLALPKRASSGPRTRIDARIRLTSSYGVSAGRTSEVSRTSSPCFHAVPTPRCSSTSTIVMQSWIRGTLRSVNRPSASTAAAMSLSAEFLAPAIWMIPSSGVPPVTRRRSIRSPSPGRPYPEAARLLAERGAGQRLRELGPDGRVVVLSQARLQLRNKRLGSLPVDLGVELRTGREHVHSRGVRVAGDVEKAPVDDRRLPGPGLVLDPQGADRQADQQRRVAGQDPDHAVGPACDHHLGLAGPDLALGRDEMDLERHLYGAPNVT